MDLAGSNDRDSRTMLLQYLQLLNAQQQQQQQPCGTSSVSAPPPPPPPAIVQQQNQQQAAPSPSPSSNEAELFPFILYGLLDDAAKTRQTHIVSWLPGGKSFSIRDVRELATKFLPVYFPTLTLSAVNSGSLARTDINDAATTVLVKTFVSRLIDDWGFSLEAGGSFFHPCFQSDNISLLKFMRCSSNSNRTSTCDSNSSASDNSSTVSRVTASTTTTSAPPVATAAAWKTAPGYSSIGNLAVLQKQARPNLLGSGNLQQNDNLVSVLLQRILASGGQQPGQGTNSAPVPESTTKPMTATIAALKGLSKPPVPESQNKNSPTTAKPPAPVTRKTTAAQPRPKVVTKIPKTVSSVKKEAVPSVKKTPSKKKDAQLAFLKKRTMNNKSALPCKKKQKKSTDATASSTLLTPSKSTSSIIVPRFSFVLNEDFRQVKDKDLPCLLFPWKIHDLLDDSENDSTGAAGEGLSRIVSWKADGTSFVVHDRDRFVQQVLTSRFKGITTWEDFTTTLADWGFVQFTSGAQKGSFFHRLLVKGKRSLCKQMRIQGKTVSESTKQHDQFLIRLHALLSHSEKDGANKSIVCWSHDGKKFSIYDRSAFIELSLVYFDSMTYGSFEQKLRRWGFVRTPSNLPLDKETKIPEITYCHPLFTKNRSPTVTWVSAVGNSSMISPVRPEARFLVRLRVMLNDCSRNGYHYAVSWLSHGKSFMIYDRAFFSEKILPLYFKGKLNSFRQSLRSHGFGQMGATNCWDEGAHYHKLFIRDSPMLCQGVTPEQMKKSMPDWIPAKDEPNFYEKRAKP